MIIVFCAIMDGFRMHVHVVGIVQCLVLSGPLYNCERYSTRGDDDDDVSFNKLSDGVYQMNTVTPTAIY